MNGSNVLIIARLFLHYFVRKSLSVGILRNRFARIVLGAGSLLGILLLGAVATAVFQEMIPGRRELVLVLHVSSVTVVFWTFIVFLFIKILFMKSDSLIRYTLVLPVSHRERSAALALYELVMVAGSIGALFLPISIASFVRLGLEAAPSLLSGIGMTAVSAYLVLSVAHNMIARTVEALGAARLVHVVTLSLVAGATLWYNGASMGLIQAMAGDYLAGKVAFRVVNLFPYLHETAGWLAAGSAFLALSAVLVILAMVSSPATFPIHRRFVKVPVPFSSLGLWPTAAALVRRSEWWIAVAVTYICAAMLWLGGGAAFVFAGVILVSQGIYVYAAVNPLRQMPGYRRSPGSEVGHMLLGQTIVAVVHAVPIAVFSILRPEALDSLRFMAIGLVSGAILTTLIAIVFVAENDSPLVVFAGYAICIAVLVSLAAMVGVLRLPSHWLWFGAACAHALAVVYSVVGMKHIMRSKRHEARLTRG